MDEINEIVAKFIDFANVQDTGNGVKNLRLFSQGFFKEYRGLKVQFSVGKGRATNIPWISFLGDGQETQKGIYPVFLYYKDINIIFLAYGISITNEPVKKWKIENPITLGQYGKDKGLNIPKKYDKSYFYKAYDPNKLENYNIHDDLNFMIDEYYQVIQGHTVETNILVSFLDPFIDWFIKNDGRSHNYFKHTFSGNRDILKKNLIQYEEIYFQEFNSKIFELNDIKLIHSDLAKNLDSKSGYFFDFSAKKSNHMPRAILGKNNYLKFLGEIFQSKLGEAVNYREGFNPMLGHFGLNFPQRIVNCFSSSLLTKSFVILTGLSGSGKTKLAQAFAMWISENKEQYALVPVGADWTNREPLLGYPNSLKANHYVKPDTGVLDILLRAHEDYMANEKDLAKCTPFFLILDEMNLSHVERYFADFLSTMESGDEIKLYSGSQRYAELDADDNAILGTEIPDKIILPKNLFIIGTVNIDETTYMFSPKVLDRANTIEFRITPEEMEVFYQNNKPLNMHALMAQGKDKAPAFMSLAAGNNLAIDRSKHKNIFVAFFETLQVAGAEFGYRTANEMTALVSYLVHFGMSESEAYDVAIMQKLLPKLHGSRSKLNKVIPRLIELCQDKYPISLEKLERMKKNAEENGFASYAEA